MKSHNSTEKLFTVWNVGRNPVVNFPAYNIVHDASEHSQNSSSLFAVNADIPACLTENNSAVLIQSNTLHSSDSAITIVPGLDPILVELETPSPSRPMFRGGGGGSSVESPTEPPPSPFLHMN